MVEFVIRDFEGIRVDTKNWPMVLWESPPERVPDAAASRALEYIAELWRETPAGSKSFMVTDLTQMRQVATASQRRFAADFVERHEHLQQRASAGGAIVLSSSVVRGVITAVLWLRPPKTPSKIVSTRQEGYAHGVERLEAAGIAIPPHVRALGDPPERRMAAR